MGLRDPDDNWHNPHDDWRRIRVLQTQVEHLDNRIEELREYAQKLVDTEYGATHKQDRAYWEQIYKREVGCNILSILRG